MSEKQVEELEDDIVAQKTAIVKYLQRFAVAKYLNMWNRYVRKTFFKSVTVLSVLDFLFYL